MQPSEWAFIIAVETVAICNIVLVWWLALRWLLST